MSIKTRLANLEKKLAPQTYRGPGKVYFSGDPTPPGAKVIHVFGPGRYPHEALEEEKKSCGATGQVCSLNPSYHQASHLQSSISPPIATYHDVHLTYQPLP